MASITYIDPAFPMPEGMDPQVWQRAEYSSIQPGGVPIEGNGVNGVDSDTTIVEDDSDAPETVPTPDNLVISGQVLRRAQDGTIVVDIIVDVDEVPGAENYEFRLTKVQ